jgi:hypothetical protein
LPAFAPVTFFNRARDITAGCATILELLEQDDLSEDSATDGERPMLSISSRSELMRMTIAALSLLSEDAAARIDWVHKTAKRQSCGQRRQKGGT